MYILVEVLMQRGIPYGSEWQAKLMNTVPVGKKRRCKKINKSIYVTERGKNNFISVATTGCIVTDS
jgi:hypothetical protein